MPVFLYANKTVKKTKKTIADVKKADIYAGRRSIGFMEGRLFKLLKKLKKPPFSVKKTLDYFNS